MPFIIDGNNLIGSSPDISLDDPNSRKKLILLIKKFQENKNNNILVVFDGEPIGNLHIQPISNKLTVMFPKYGSSADEEIKKLLDSYNDFRDVMLVSSDRELKSFAKKKGAKVVNSIEFYFELKRLSHFFGKKEESQKRINLKLTKNEIDRWLKIFTKK